MLRGRRRPSARGRSRAGWLLLAAGVSCHPPARGGPAPQGASGVAIRVNQLGYRPDAPKVAVVCALEPQVIATFRVVDERDRTVFGPSAADPAGSFGPCAATYRLDFSTLERAGVYRIVAGGTCSLPVRIADDVYRGAADSLLAYLREQRSGYNPVFRDSVHQHTDGVLVDHPTRSGEFIPVSGGWADASDYLQYGATTAHATTMLLLAYRDHPEAFADRFQANGLPGANGIPDVLDEARWGLAWLVKMYPEDDLLLNQLGDDRDHAVWDLPINDSSDYGWGRGGRRPVYPCTGKPQGTVRVPEPLHRSRVDGGEIRGGVRPGRRRVPSARQRVRQSARRPRASRIQARRRASGRVSDGARALAVLLRGGQLGGRYGARRRGALWSDR